MMKEEKSAWDDVSRVWKRIAAVIAACSAGAAFLINGFGFPTDKTILYVSVLGIMVLIISFYVDKQTKYIREEIREKRKESEDKLSAHISESNRVIGKIDETLIDIKKTTDDTRKDTLRIQLLMVIRDDPNNTDTILKLAETYFVKLKGDWYMTSVFMQWATEHDIMIPDVIFTSLNATKND